LWFVRTYDLPRTRQMR